MNDYRRISIVNEFNEETQQWEIRSVVLFRDGEAPLIEDFNGVAHLSIIAQFIEENGFDILDNGFANAVEAGIISAVRRDDRRQMALLNSEILQEQIRYSNVQEENILERENQEEPTEEEVAREETVERRLYLSNEDRQLADYFRRRLDLDRKTRLNNNGQLPPVGIAAMEEDQEEINRLAEENERVAALEEARTRLLEGRLSQEEYDRIYNTYREQLAEAIRNVETTPVEDEPEAEVENELFNDEDQRNFDAMMDVIDMCRECRVNDERFEVVINRGLEDNSTREVRITLVGGIARDSYEFRFENGELFDQHLNEIIENVSINDAIVSREETPTELSERISDSITVITTEEGNQIVIRYSVPTENVELESELMDSNPVEPEPTPEEEIVVEQDNDETREATTQTRRMLNLADEDRELANYFRLSMLRDNNQLSAEQLEEIASLAESNERVAALEEARRRLNEGRLSQEEYDRIHDTYRAQLAEAIRNAEPVVVENREEGPTLRRRINLPEEDRQLADYFRRRVDLDRKTRLNNNGQLPPTGIAAMEEDQEEINRLVEANERVAGLEEARRRLNEGRLSQNEYDRIYSTYRAQLADSIREAAEQSQENRNEIESDNTDRQVAEEAERERLRRRILEILEERRNALQQQENERRELPVRPTSEEPATPVIPPVRPTSEEPTTPVMPPVRPTSEEPATPVIPPVRPTSEEPATPVIPPVRPTSEEPATPVIPPVRPTSEEPATPVMPPVRPTSEEPATPVALPVRPTNTNPQGVVLNPSGPNNGNPVQTAGNIPTEGQNTNVPGVPGTVKVTKKGNRFLRWLAAGAAFIVGVLGLHSLATWLENRFNPKTETSQNAQEGPTTSVINTRVNNYFDKMNVPAATRAFISQDSVMEFLGEFKNEDQFNEVLSALCYGYEANILTTKDGNFRLDADGNNYLRSFTSDFLCAKVVVNNYTPEQMRAVFGDTNITYEQIMDGFRSYCTTVAVYSTTATEPLPFKYLTNGDINATEALNNLSTRLSVVNINRENGTLTSRHTDAFISAVHKLFVQNDQALGLTEGTKTVATALVDGYMYSQAQVSNGEALYLHADDGYAKAGINLREVDGRISIVSGDSTAYQFSNLYDVINYGYGNIDAADRRCVNAQQVLLENLSEMRELSNATTEQAALEFANLLYQNGMKAYGDEISKGNYSPELLARIEAANPVLSDEVDDFERTMNASETEYVPFGRVTSGVDELLGITQTRNNINDLINVRRSMLYMYNDYEVTSGRRYVSNNTRTNNTTTNTPSNTYVPSETVTTTTTTQEQVEYDDLTPEEQEEADSIIEQLQQATQVEQTQNQQEGIDAMREAVASGATEAEVVAIGAQYGITVDEDYYENMTAALNQQAQGEEIAAETDEEYARRNEEARREAEERARREAEEEARRRAEQQALIEQGQGLGTGETYDPETDPDRVDHEAGEEPYVPTSSTTKEGLIAARDLLTAHMDIASLGLEAENDLGNTRTM